MFSWVTLEGPEGQAIMSFRNDDLLFVYITGTGTVGPLQYASAIWTYSDCLLRHIEML